MSRAVIHSGVCGFVTIVDAKMEDDKVTLEIKSGCEAIQNLAKELTQVNPYKEISTRRVIPQTLQMGMKYCAHAACPVAVGIIKAIEVEAGLALPADVSIKITKTSD
jgi:hypothetical protein